MLHSAIPECVVLLDTNVLLAAIMAPDRLPTEIQDLLRNPANSIYFSAANIWEVAIKQSLQRDDFDFQSEDVEKLALETGFTELPLRSAHCHAVNQMPWHHRDPFDRLLVAQARSLPARLLTTDGQLAPYSELVWTISLRQQLDRQDAGSARSFSGP